MLLSSGCPGWLCRRIHVASPKAELGHIIDPAIPKGDDLGSPSSAADAQPEHAGWMTLVHFYLHSLTSGRPAPQPGCSIAVSLGKTTPA